MNITSAKLGAGSTGKTRLISYLSGLKISRAGAMSAKCFECMGGYADGRMDCKMPNCPLYPWMPYREAAMPLYDGPKRKAKVDKPPLAKA